MTSKAKKLAKQLKKFENQSFDEKTFIEAIAYCQEIFSDAGIVATQQQNYSMQTTVVLDDAARLFNNLSKFCVKHKADVIIPLLAFCIDHATNKK